MIVHQTEPRHGIDFRRPRTWRAVRRITGVTTAALALLLGVSPMGCYLSRAAFEEARILTRRQPIARLVADPATEPALRDKLALVQDVRRFAIDSLHLKAGNSFTAYAGLDRDTLVLVVSAAYR
ncbi:MAG: aminopeptidase, partial [Gemmatimonadota bacterium]|nr:aminopeptidase [Gemmatimonadota bacterium]